MRVDVATPRVLGERGAPRGRIGGPGRDVRGDGRAGEEPDGDGLAGPFGRVDAAAHGIEAVAEVRGAVGEDGAAGVFGLFGRVGVAVGGVDQARHAGFLDGAVAGGVEGHGVGRRGVDAFDDVDFAHGGPIRANEPEGGPNTADPAGHVRNVRDKKAFVVGLFGSEADTLAACVRGGVVVDAHIGGITVIADRPYHLVLHRGCIVHVLHETCCGVCLGEGCEGVEEIIALEVVGEGIAGYAYVEERCQGKKAGESV